MAGIYRWQDGHHHSDVPHVSTERGYPGHVTAAVRKAIGDALGTLRSQSGAWAASRSGRPQADGGLGKTEGRNAAKEAVALQGLLQPCERREATQDAWHRNPHGPEILQMLEAAAEAGDGQGHAEREANPPEVPARTGSPSPDS